jgi:PAS domain S-box-containing protein
VESSADAIIATRLDGSITSWNAGAQRIYGYSASEMVGASLARLVPTDRQTEEDDILTRIERGERVEHFETVRRTKDGKRIDVSLTVSPIYDQEGVIRGASHVARDISDRFGTWRRSACIPKSWRAWGYSRAVWRTISTTSLPESWKCQPGGDSMPVEPQPAHP